MRTIELQISYNWKRLCNLHILYCSGGRVSAWVPASGASSKRSRAPSRGISTSSNCSWRGRRRAGRQRYVIYSTVQCLLYCIIYYIPKCVWIDRCSIERISIAITTRASRTRSTRAIAVLWRRVRSLRRAPKSSPFSSSRAPAATLHLVLPTPDKHTYITCCTWLIEILELYLLFTCRIVCLNTSSRYTN